METRFLFTDGNRGPLNRVKDACPVCAACNPANYSLHWTPIPNNPMESVSMGVFSMAKVTVGKAKYDYVEIIVDRHSGYLVAVLAQKKGLAAKEVAEQMIKH